MKEVQVALRTHRFDFLFVELPAVQEQGVQRVSRSGGLDRSRGHVHEVLVGTGEKKKIINYSHYPQVATPVTIRHESFALAAR